MKESEFNLAEFKQKIGYNDTRQKIIGERDQVIRDRLHKQEQYKMMTIENYCYDWYGIICYNIIYLLKQYHLTDEYVTDQYSNDFLLPKNNIDDNNK